MNNKKISLVKRVVLFLCGFVTFCVGLSISAQVIKKSSGDHFGSELIEKNPLWVQAKDLADKQQYQAALTSLQRLKEEMKRGDDVGLTTVLIQSTLYKVALHGVETAVRDLKKEKWPQEELSQTLLRVIYAQALVRYFDYYNFEINQRTKLDGQAEIDLKDMTSEQIFAEAVREYAKIWDSRDKLNTIQKDFYSRFIIPNTFPSLIKSNFYDSYIELFKNLLSDTRGWSPDQLNEKFLLSVQDLIIGKKVDLTSSKVHPLAKVAYVLRSQFDFHKKNNQSGAALQSRLDLYQILFGHLTSEHSWELLLIDLDKELLLAQNDPWYSMGLARKSEFLLQMDGPTNKIEARKWAEKGANAYPKSDGGRLCRDIIKIIDRPELVLQGMRVDGPGRSKGLGLKYSNVNRVYFRSYEFDIKNKLIESKDYSVLPEYREIETIIKGQPTQEWSADLPRTKDFKTHSSQVTMPVHKRGFYIIVASLRKDFSNSENVMSGIFVTVSDLVLSHRSWNSDGSMEVQIQNGLSGLPLAGASVRLIEMDYQTGHHEIDTKKTNEQGLVYFKPLKLKAYSNYILIAEKDNSVAFSSSNISLYKEDSPVTKSYPVFLYSDRSIYRPEQKIYWKLLSFEGEKASGPFSARKNKHLQVQLRDANNEMVFSKIVTTDEFGAAFGEFQIPRGKLLGGWRLIAGDQARQLPVRVEEYKRPTFEVALHEAKKPLRLNKEALFSGDAKYYFGMPLTNGKMKYRIYRSGVMPWWAFWCFWDWGLYTREQLVEYGFSDLNKDGNFNISFTPKADEKLARTKDGKVNQDTTFNYRLEVDVTDEGGETRSTQKNFYIGFVTVKAHIHLDQGFVSENKDFKMTLSRTDLSGAERSGLGSWALYQLEEPKTVKMPSEVKLPNEVMRFFQGIPVEGDDEASRYEVRYDWNLMVESWKLGAKVQEGKGIQGALSLQGLKAGIYRLVYKTKDDFDSEITSSRNFVVAGPQSQFSLPFFMALEKISVPVGGKARLFVMSGFKDQTLQLEKFHAGKLVDKKILKGGQVIEFDVKEADRGGYGFSLSLLRDYQSISTEAPLYVPWDNKELKLEWSTFRDKIRPGDEETWELTIKSHDKKNLKARSAQVLAYMYDKSLDFFMPHFPLNPTSIYPNLANISWWTRHLGSAVNAYIPHNLTFTSEFSEFVRDRVIFEYSYGVGGPGRRGGYDFGGMRGEVHGSMAVAMDAIHPKKMAQSKGDLNELFKEKAEAKVGSKSLELSLPASAPLPPSEPKSASAEAISLRTQFQETAFWYPSLISEKKSGVKIQFKVPDSLTSWNVWALAFTEDLKAGLLQKTTQTIKELMVRPYLPRFFREGDSVDVKVVLNNSSEKSLSGNLDFVIQDAVSKKDLSSQYKLQLSSNKFVIPPKGSVNVTAHLMVPNQVGAVIVEVKAKSNTGFSDGERRELPVIPGRIHLAQSRFKVLKGASSQVLKFQDLIDNKDKSLINEQMVVTLDAQLFYSVLSSLPYLVNYPYECIEQTLNRFVSTGILTSIFQQYPAVAKMAKEFSTRKTPLEAWGDKEDPNRKISLEESPWLQESRGHLSNSDGSDPQLIAVLDPRVAEENKAEAIKKLEKAQTSLGGFPWFSGGPPSPYMTMYVLYGLSKAIEFGVEVPKPLVQKAWSYMKRHYIDEIVTQAFAHDCCWEEVTFLNYVLSNYKDVSWGNNVFTADDRKKMADFSFKHWKLHSPYLKGYLSLTLSRMNRKDEGRLVWASVMDSAKTSEEEGTHWAAEDRSWLWYNDTIETHAFALRTGMELGTNPDQLDGMVLWLFLNKKLNHWKSTRATAEVIYSLTHYLKKTGNLGVKESAEVKVGDLVKNFEFSPDKYSGKKNQIVIPGEKISPTTGGSVQVAKNTPGYLFASATWHFSTLEMPKESRGDFIQIERTYFKRDIKKGEMTLTPLKGGKEQLKVGDEVEVHVSIKTKHAMEYVHLRDPRPAGFEPSSSVSSHKWDLGIYWYEEVRDTGMNFFFERLPQGQYTFKYRIRAANGGKYVAAPATISPMYAPEFTAYSSGGSFMINF